MDDPKIAAMRRYAVWMLVAGLAVMALVGLRNLTYMNELRRAADFAEQHPDLLVVNAFSEPELTEFDERMVDRTWLIDAQTGESHRFTGEGINSFNYTPDHSGGYLVFSTQPDPGAGLGAVGRAVGKTFGGPLRDWSAQLRGFWKLFAGDHGEPLLLDPSEDPALGTLPVLNNEASGAMRFGSSRLGPLNGNRRMLTPLLRPPPISYPFGLGEVESDYHPHVLEFRDGKLNSAGSIPAPSEDERLQTLAHTGHFATVVRVTPQDRELRGFDSRDGSFFSLEPAPGELHMLNAAPLDPEGTRWLGYAAENPGGSESYHEVLFVRNPEDDALTILDRSELELPPGVGALRSAELITRGKDSIPAVQFTMYSSGGRAGDIWLRTFRSPLGDDLEGAEVVNAEIESTELRRGHFDTHNGDYFNWIQQGGSYDLVRYPWPWRGRQPERLVSFPAGERPERFIVYRVTGG